MAQISTRSLFVVLATILVAISNAVPSNAADSRIVATTTFMDAKATYYGGNDASGTMSK